MTSKQFLDNVAKMLNCQSVWIDVNIHGLIQVLFIDKTSYSLFKMGFWKYERPMTIMYVDGCTFNEENVNDEFYE